MHHTRTGWSTRMHASSFLHPYTHAQTFPRTLSWNLRAERLFLRMPTSEREAMLKVVPGRPCVCLCLMCLFFVCHMTLLLA